MVGSAAADQVLAVCKQQNPQCGRCEARKAAVRRMPCSPAQCRCAWAPQALAAAHLQSRGGDACTDCSTADHFACAASCCRAVKPTAAAAAAADADCGSTRQLTAALGAVLPAFKATYWLPCEPRDPSHLSAASAGT